MYPNYINKPSFMTNTSSSGFGASTSSFGQPATNTPMFSSMQPSNIFQTPNTSSFNAGPSAQSTFGKPGLSRAHSTSSIPKACHEPPVYPLITVVNANENETRRLHPSLFKFSGESNSQTGSGVFKFSARSPPTSPPSSPTNKFMTNVTSQPPRPVTAFQFNPPNAVEPQPGYSGGPGAYGPQNYPTSITPPPGQMFNRQVSQYLTSLGPSTSANPSYKFFGTSGAVQPVPPWMDNTVTYNQPVIGSSKISTTGLSPAYLKYFGVPPSMEKPIDLTAVESAEMVALASPVRSAEMVALPDPAANPLNFQLTNVPGPSGKHDLGSRSNLFGQQQQPSTSGLFGSSNAFGQNKTTFGFGSTPAQTGLFGQQPQQQTGTSLFQSNTSNLFGNTNAFGNQTTGTVIKFSPVTGTDTMQKNGVTQSISTKHHCITCMKEYENKSLEELRFEDYSCNRKGPQQQTGFATGPFGATTGGASTSLFGQTDNKQGFGQTTGFGQTSTFGQTTPGFGVTNQTNTPSLFGKPTFGTTTSNTTTFGFNATPSTSNPFSASQAPKPFCQQPLFGTNTTQPQNAFGTGVFGQTNNQNTTNNLFQKTAQPTTGFNTGQPGFSFNQTGTTQAPNLFQTPKPTTGFGIFGQTNTSTTGFGQTNQTNFGTSFGKISTSFPQPTQPAFGTNLTGGLQQPLFGNTNTKSTSLFGSNTSGGGLFTNNVFQPTPTSFSLNMNSQQPVQFPPEPTDDQKNISLVATDSFPDGPHVYGLEPVLTESTNSTTNPQDIKAMLDYSKKRDELLGARSKIKVHLPKPKRGNNYNKEFFETNQALRSSHKCLVIRKFNDNSTTIYNKYKNELLEEAEECIKPLTEGDSSTSSLVSPRSVGSDKSSSIEMPDVDYTKGRSRLGLRLFDSSYSDITLTEDKTAKNNFSYGDPPTFVPLVASDKTFGLADEDDTSTTENGFETPSNTSLNTNEVENTENPAGVVLTRPEYYMYPALKDLHQYMDENGECIVQGLTIGRRGYGNVYFPDPIDISNMNLDEIVFFRHREIIVYPDDNKKPPVGEGLNRRAQVTLDKIYPREKGTNNYIIDVNQIIQSSFVDNLMAVTQKHNCKFVDYRPKTGSWVFKVKHFSKYAFTDSDEEECEVAPEKNAGAKMPQTSLKKIEEIEESPKFGLGGEQQLKPQLIADSEQISSDPNLSDFWSDEQFMISEDVYHTESSIQTIKSSLFTNLDMAPQVKKTETVTSLKTTFEIPNEVISLPKVYKLPNISLAAVHQKITSTQRCYTELGIFKNDTFKVGWGKGFNFFNFEMMADTEVVYALSHCNIQVGNSGSYNAMMPNLVDLLKITLDESEFHFDGDNIPTLNVKQDLSYLQKQTKLFNDHVQKFGLTGKEKYLCSVWNLCTALWGAGDDSPCGRRQYLSNWLKQFTYDLCNEWNMNTGLNEVEAFSTIFKLLTFHKISEACEFASMNNLSQLSVLISQVSANERYKFWMRKFIESFGWKEKGIILEKFKKLYLLLCGIPVYESINICDDLDWLRSFALHLWYIAPAAAPIDVAFNLYKKAFEELDYAVSPAPPYCDSKNEPTDYDLLYHILSVYVSSTHQLRHVLHPETHTDNVMDYRFSWFMLHLFRSLNCGLISESEQEYLHTTFSNQLENMGHWKWAIFALLFLKDNVVKKNLIIKILDRNLHRFTETKDVERELVKVFKIPAVWIHKVKATKAKLSGYYYEYFQHCMYMQDWQEANTALVNYIIPELFINEQYDYLIKFINKVEPISNTLVNWGYQGGLLKDFIEIQDMLYQSNEEAIKHIGSKLSTLFHRVNCFPVKNDKQKLCVAELSRKCALLFKMVHKNLSDDDFKVRLINILSNMVMPPDIKYYEMYQFLPQKEQMAQ